MTTAEQVLRQILKHIQDFMPPDGLTAEEAINKIIPLVDPWPLQALEDIRVQRPTHSAHAQFNSGVDALIRSAPSLLNSFARLSKALGNPKEVEAGENESVEAALIRMACEALESRAVVTAPQQKESGDNGGKTGHPPGMLQDDHKGLSRWLSTRPNARAEARAAADEIAASRAAATAPAVHAIQFAITNSEGLEFLRHWMHGDWDVIRREWPEAPASVVVASAAATAPAIQLGGDGQKVFAKTLLNPPPPTAAFLKAEERYSNLIRPEATAPAGGVTDDQIMDATRAFAADGGRWPSDWIAAGRAVLALTTAARAAEPALPNFGGDERRHIICLCPDCMKPVTERSGGVMKHVGWRLTTKNGQQVFIKYNPAEIPSSPEIRKLEKVYVEETPFAASPTPPTGTEKKKDAEPVVHQGMTIAGDGAAMLGRLMREQRASRLGVYPDGNPNAGTEKP